MKLPLEKNIRSLGRLLPQCMLHDQVRLGLQLRRILKNPERINDTLLKKLTDKAFQSIELREKREQNIPQLSYPSLPVSERKNEIVEAIRNNQIIIISGETGSGKTTQIPKMCLEAGLGGRAMIGCTQPRRVAAMSLSKRLAEEMEVDWGREVGCKIRFSTHCHPETYIKMMTDGILLSEIQSDPFLCEYDAILVDEAHERTLNIDFLLGYLKELTRKRDDLKIIITSATIDTESFSEAFNKAPILEVSGRMYPVEICYQEMDHASEEREDYTFTESSVETVSQILQQTYNGDILVFMPSERDIHKTIEVMTGRQWQGIEILPLYGRQSSAEQQRVFTLSKRRRVIVATNVAETSLTIPNVHFVVDTGMARISRYNARTRTKRLPIEFISQSSANQRKGRCGRVASGVCYRLYSEKDFNELQPYTQPEIQRANLAEVILRMTAFGLGQIETFPFINPPSSQAIHAGYSLLQELGALDENLKLTQLGMELARMALDPSLGRMVLQAREEGVLEEVIIIAAGLSVQDVRERPTEQRAQAASAHKEFADPESDFITLLNIWKAWRAAWQELRTENQVRKFCRAHFISFVRMREWSDLYDQLKDIILELGQGEGVSIDRKAPQRSTKGRKCSRPTSELSEAIREGIHRSVLSGLLGHIAQRKARNQYKAVGDREVMLFPGSNLFDKSKPPSSKKSKKAQDSESGGNIVQSEWIVAGEIVETSRLFARTVAGIDISWVEEIAPHICKKTYHDAHWDEKKERVVVLERVRAHGLLIQERWIDYGKINSKEATDIFIRQALVKSDEEDGAYSIQGRLLSGFRKNLKFIEHNQNLCQKLELWQTHKGGAGFVNVYESICLFYGKWIQGVSSIHDLNRIIKENQHQKNFLFATEKDLLGEHSQGYDSQFFPDRINLSGYSVGATYAYAPGKQQDGVTFKIPLSLLPMVDKRELDWGVPGFRVARWEQFLESLPRQLRRRLMPIREKASRLAEVVTWNSAEGLKQASDLILREWGVEIPENLWDETKLPDYLTPKIEVFNRENKQVLAGVDLKALQSKIKEHAEKESVKDWQKLSEKWEKYDIADWLWEDIPESIVVKEEQHVPLLAFPGLDVEGGDVNLRLFRTPAERDKVLMCGISALAEKVMQKELSWVRRDLNKMASGSFSYSTLGTGDELAETAYLNLRNYIFESDAPPRLTRQYFETFLKGARKKLGEGLPQLISLTREILELRQQILVYPKQFDWLKKELNMLVSQKFLAYIPLGRLRHLPRYLKMLLIRADRAAADPVKDQKKSQHVEIWQKELDELLRKKDLSPEARSRLWNLFWMMQEFKVSCYAQELGTSEPVSEKRLGSAISEIRKLFKTV